MKGGKKGRDPKTGGGRGKPKPAPAKRPGARPPGTPPPKGARKRPDYGGTSSRGDD